MFHSHPAIFLTPAVINVVTDPNLLADYRFAFCMEFEEGRPHIFNILSRPSSRELLVVGAKGSVKGMAKGKLLFFWL